MLSTGQKAPDFTLFKTNRKEIPLTDFRKKNVIRLYFSMAFTRVCTTELCEMRDNISIDSDLEAGIIAISVDSPFSLVKFKED